MPQPPKQPDRACKRSNQALYSRETTNNATPFKNTRSPVFMTAERADVRNADQVAIYTGDARGWQDDNFVKGDRIELYQDDKHMVARME